MTGFVYKWYDTSNGMYYIGSHKGTPGDRYIGSGKWFSRAYKSRPQSFVREVLYIGEHFVELEGFILQELNAKSDNKSYNLTNRASEIPESKKHSCERKKKWSKERSGEGNAMYGKKHSEYSKKKISINKTKYTYFCEHTGKEYSNIGELSLDLGVSKSYAYTMCSGYDNNKYGITKVEKNK